MIAGPGFIISVKRITLELHPADRQAADLNRSIEAAICIVRFQEISDRNRAAALQLLYFNRASMTGSDILHITVDPFLYLRVGIKSLVDKNKDPFDRGRGG
jgi:hypothetical protein